MVEHCKKQATEKEEKFLGSGSCQESIEISRLHPSPSSTCQKFPKSPLPCHSSSGPRTPSRNASNTPALVENPLSSSTPGESFKVEYMKKIILRKRYYPSAITFPPELAAALSMGCEQLFNTWVHHQLCFLATQQYFALSQCRLHCSSSCSCKHPNLQGNRHEVSFQRYVLKSKLVKMQTLKSCLGCEMVVLSRVF